MSLPNLPPTTTCSEEEATTTTTTTTTTSGRLGSSSSLSRSRIQSVATTLHHVDDNVWHDILIESDLQASLLRQDGRLLRNIHKKIDVSEEALRKIFDMLDREETGYLSEAQFIEGLNRCLLAFGGTALPPDFGPSETIWKAGSTENHTRLSREAFGMIMRRLKMDILLPPAVPKSRAAAAGPTPMSKIPSSSGGPQVKGGGERSPMKPPSLFGFPSSMRGSGGGGDGDGRASMYQQTMLKNDNQVHDDVVMKVFDFTKHQMHKRDIVRGKLRDFFLTKHTKDVVLKWIMVECHDYTNILRLAVKYSIHNLHLEDVLKLETQKPKVTNYGHNHFVIIPIMRLTRETDKALQAWLAEHHDDVGIDSQGRRKTPFPIMLEEATAGIFSVGPPEHDSTVITIRTIWRPLNNKTGQVKQAMRSNNKQFSQGGSSSSRAAATGAGVSSSQEKSSSFSFRRAASSSLRSVSTTTSGTTPGIGMRQRTSSTLGNKETPASASSMPSSQRYAQLHDHQEDSPASFPLEDVFARRTTQKQQQQQQQQASEQHISSETHSNPPSTPRTGRSLAATVADEMSRTFRATIPQLGGAADMGKDNDGQEELDDEWADIFDPDEEEGDSSVTAALAEDDQYFDGQMMHDVAESVYHTNGRASGDTGQWLLHSIMDHTVDRLLPIVECYQIRVSYFQDLLHQRGANFGKNKLKDVMDTKLDLLWLQRRIALLKPMLRHLMRTVPADLQLYYQDVDDHLERCLEGLSSLCNMAQSIIDEAHHYREERINEILLFITVLTSIFTPASFIAGVYGMNFEVMPELQWKRGYMFFWLLSVLLSSLILFMVRYKVRKLGKW